MTPHERRGKWLFLFICSLLILENLVSVGLALTNKFTEINWLKSVFQPLGMAISMAFLWKGESWLRWLVGGYYAFSGGLQMYLSLRALIILAGSLKPQEKQNFMQLAIIPFGLVGVYAFLHFLAGMMILFSPSIKAFFQYQHNRPSGDVERSKPENEI